MRSFSAILKIFQEASLSRNWDLKDELYIKRFSWTLYTVAEQQWISSAIVEEVQWSSRRRSILKRRLTESDSGIAERTSGTSTNKEVWIASISGNWGAMGLIFKFLIQTDHRGAERKRMPRILNLSAYANWLARSTSCVQHHLLHTLREWKAIMPCIAGLARIDTRRSLLWWHVTGPSWAIMTNTAVKPECWPRLSVRHNPTNAVVTVNDWNREHARS